MAVLANNGRRKAKKNELAVRQPSVPGASPSPQSRANSTTIILTVAEAEGLRNAIENPEPLDPAVKATWAEYFRTHADKPDSSW